MPFAVACARTNIASASPLAILICSARNASDARITLCFRPSAILIALCLCPSLSRISARLLRSAVTCLCIAPTTPSGAWISRISYRKHTTPQSRAASLIASVMFVLRAARSRRTWSSVNRPISLRIVVCASWLMAYSASSTP